MSEQVKPPRPAIPVTFYCLMCVLAAESALLGMIPLGFPAHMGLATLAFALVTVLIAFLFHAELNHPTGAVLALSLAAGVWVSYAAFCRGLAFQAEAQDVPVSAWRFEVLSDSSESSYGWRCRARVAAEGMPPCDVWLMTDDPLDYGTVLFAVGRYTPNPDSEWGRVSLRQGVWGTDRKSVV